MVSILLDICIFILLFEEMNMEVNLENIILEEKYLILLFFYFCSIVLIIIQIIIKVSY